MPESYWLKFKSMNEDWVMNKMGQWIKPENSCYARFLHCVTDGVKNNELCIILLDSPLVAPYGPEILRYNKETRRQNLYFNLYNNLWNTNFPMWYSEDSKFRFNIRKIK